MTLPCVRVNGANAPGRYTVNKAAHFFLLRHPTAYFSHQAVRGDASLISSGGVA